MSFLSQIGVMLALVLLPTVSAQYPFVGFTATSDCSSTQFFDSSSLECNSCGTNQVQDSNDPESCVCDTGYLQVDQTISDLESFTCTDSCILDGKASLADRSACIRCATSFGTDECVCGTNEILVEYDGAGNVLFEKICVSCPNNTIAVDAYTCEPCGDDRMISTNGVCQCPSTYTEFSYAAECLKTSYYTALNARFTVSSAATVAYHDVRTVDDGDSVTETHISYTFTQLWQGSAIKCQYHQDRDACHAILNMCAQQIFLTSASVCEFFDELLENPNFVSTSHGFDDWRATLPMLQYSDDRVINYDVLQSSVTFDTTDEGIARDPIDTVRFILVSYAQNGTLLAIEDLSDQLLLCGGNPQNDWSTKWQQFGNTFMSKCTLDLNNLLSYETVFYDLYWVDKDSKLYPVPIKILNYRQVGGNQPNVNGDGEINEPGNMVLHRRFFLVDTSSGITSSGSDPEVVTYARKLKLMVQLNPDKAEHIYPPTLTVTYAQRKPSNFPGGDEAAESLVEFRVEYLSNQEEIRTWGVVLFSFAIIATVILGGLRFHIYNSENHMGEMTVRSLVTFILYPFNQLADSFLWLVFFLSCYCFIFFKGQSTVHFLLPMADGTEYKEFEAFIIIMIVGKSLGMIITIWEQIYVSCFIVDWEQPPGRFSQSALGSTPVSVWRKLFVANKWVDLCNDRIISVPFTLFWMALILKGAGLEYLATSQPDLILDADAAPINPFLRFCVHTFFFIVLCGGQWFFKSFLMRHFVESKVNQFIDLTSLANCSLFIFDSTYHCFYIHGKTVHTHADATLEELHKQLQSEEENWIRERGLLPGQDVFSVYVTPRFRDEYDEKAMVIENQEIDNSRARRKALAAGGRNVDMTAAEVEAKSTERLLESSNDLQDFLMKFIQKANTKHKWGFGERSMCYKRFGMPPPNLNSLDGSHFYTDDMNSFTKVMLQGIEWDLMKFSVMLFALVDILADEVLVSCLVVYLVDQSIIAIRHYFGKKNFANGSLIDEKFLI